MGMDVYGIAPENEIGEYFRNNVWYWRPLWEFCCELDCELADKVPLAYSNDGDGLKNCEDCVLLADKIQNSIDNGFADFYIRQREIRLSLLQEEVCHLCNGTGSRIDDLGRNNVCYYCSGQGKTPHWDTHYHLDIENIKNFEKFLRSCGGFRIC